ncbi:MAG: DUF5615 family PIN-like protein [Planctomycetota bacterium]
MRNRAARRIVVVLDENLSGQRIVDGLRRNKIPVEPLTDLMERGATDEELLARLARHPDYYLLSKDSDFHRKPAVKEALIKHGVGAFVITAHKSKTAADLVELVNQAWRGMQRCARKHKRPFVAKILADARVEVVT